MIRLVLAAAAALGLAQTASAQGVFVPPPGDIVSQQRPRTGPRADLQRELRTYGFGDVDVRRLSNGQVAHLYSVVHSGRSNGDVRSAISSVLRGGLLQRGLDRLSR